MSSSAAVDTIPEDDSNVQLSKTLSLAQQLREDNEQLKHNFESLKDEYNRLRMFQDDTADKLKSAIDIKNSVESECQKLYDQWNDQLKTQSAEFSRIKAQMVPNRELEMLRVQMVNEYQNPHRDEVKILQDESARYHEKYVESRRSLELLRTEIKQSEDESATILNEAKSKHRQTVDDLQQKIKCLETKLQDPAHAETVHKMEREASELKLRVEDLSRENQSLREKEEEAIITQELSHQEHVKATKRLEGTILVKQKECYGEKIRCKELLGEINEMHDQLSSQQETVIGLEQGKLSSENVIKSLSVEKTRRPLSPNFLADLRRVHIYDVRAARFRQGASTNASGTNLARSTSGARPCRNWTGESLINEAITKRSTFGY
eukprot:260380_1